jgi:hypothetical protein
MGIDVEAAIEIDASREAVAGYRPLCPGKPGAKN